MDIVNDTKKCIMEFLEDKEKEKEAGRICE